MTVSRSMSIAFAAGVAGLVLGIVLGQAAPPSWAGGPAGTSAGVYLVVRAPAEAQSIIEAQLGEDLDAWIARHGGEPNPASDTLAQFVDDAEGIVLGRWPDLESAHAFWDHEGQTALHDAGVGAVLIETLSVEAQ